MSEEFCPRQISFLLDGNPGVRVTATENNGAIDFIVDVEDTASSTGDLRALFFDINEAKLLGLTFSEGAGLLTEARVSANNVLDLDDGANLAGKVKEAFDVGLEWGTPGGKKDDINFPVEFTMSNTAGDLTLDDIAHQRFGAKLDSIGGAGGPRNSTSKLLTISPAAPDAQDDSYDIFEDGAAGADAPSKTPQDVVLDVLTNDTDADPADVLTITEIHEQPAHGTVTIADDGKSLIYTPELDFAGQVSFKYCVSDGNGGQDNAEVTIDIEAVADDPVITWTVAQGADVNQLLITVTATQDDADSSEYIDDILASVAGGVPAGVTITPGSVNPGDEPDQIVQQFTVDTAAGTDYNFNIDFTATAVETSNGDTEDATVTQSIVIDYNTETQQGTFDATDQSIWSNGDEFTFTDDRFIGIDTGEFSPTLDGPFGTYAGVEGHIKLGLQSTLEFAGGEIDATADYDITAETTYNRTLDLLKIGTAGVLTNAFFTTQGPEGSYTLDFVYDAALRAFAGIDIEILGVGIDEEITLFNETVGPGSFNLLTVDSETLGGTIDLPPPLDAFSINYAWPHLTTNGSFPLPVDSSGASNNFLELELDLDTLVSQILFGGINPFDPPRLDAGPFFADVDLLDVDIIGGFNFLQDFLLEMGDLVGTLKFEDNTIQAFTIGDELLIPDASLIDDGGDNDGIVEFSFLVGPEAELTNETNLGFNIGVDIDLLTVEVGYDIEIDSGSTTLGPLAEFGVVEPVADVNVFNDTFALNFSDSNFAFAA